MTTAESESEFTTAGPPAVTQGASVLATAGHYCFIVCFGFVLYWNIYADRYQPIVDPGANLFPYGAAAGGLLFVLLYAGGMFRSSKATVLNDNEEADRSAEVISASVGVHPIVSALGMMILCGIFSQAWAWTLNAWCDRSPAHSRRIEVLDRTSTTHKLIFHTHKLKYRFADDPTGEAHTFKCSNAELESCDRPFVRIETHQGAFGWSWVRTVELSETDKP